MFAFRRKKPEELRYHEGKKFPTFLHGDFINRVMGKVTSSEKRAFCAKLNPSFYKPSRGYTCIMRAISAMAIGKCTCRPKLSPLLFTYFLRVFIQLQDPRGLY